MNDGNGTVARIAAAVPEQRRDLDVSLRGLARLSGVSRSTITKVEKGKPVEPALLLQIAATLTLLELYAPTVPPVEVHDDLVDALALCPYVGGAA
jgi:transcriptional regulator with XRE-family HTH domain